MTPPVLPPPPRLHTPRAADVGAVRERPVVKVGPFLGIPNGVRVVVALPAPSAAGGTAPLDAAVLQVVETGGMHLARALLYGETAMAADAHLTLDGEAPRADNQISVGLDSTAFVSMEIIGRTAAGKALARRIEFIGTNTGGTVAFDSPVSTVTLCPTVETTATMALELALSGDVVGLVCASDHPVRWLAMVRITSVIFGED